MMGRRRQRDEEFAIHGVSNFGVNLTATLPAEARQELREELTRICGVPRIRTVWSVFVAAKTILSVMPFESVTPMMVQLVFVPTV